MRHLYCWMAAAPLIVSGGVPAQAASPTAPSLFPSDARLIHPVSVSRPRIYLGELVEQLSKDGRVRLSVDDSKGAVSGIDLSVFITEQPLREVMAALALEFNTKQDPWEWQRSGSGYTLRHQQPPEAASAASRREILETWTTDLRELHRIAQLPDSGRSAEAAAHPRLLPNGNLGTVAAGELDLLGKLTSAQVDALAHGREVAFDTGQATERERAALQLGITYKTPDRGAGPPLLTPGFYVKWDSTSLSPILWMRGTTGSGSVCGGGTWDNAWLQSDANGWIGPGDPDVQKQLMQQVRGEQGLGQDLPAGPYHLWFRRVAQRQKLKLIADLVYPRVKQTIGGWIGSTPERTFRYMVPFGNMVWKPLEHIQLVRYKTAAIEPRRHLVPWAIIRELRAAADRNDGYPDGPALSYLSQMTPAQLTGLSEEFPDANPSQANPLQAWFPIFRFYRELEPRTRERLLKPGGIRYADTGVTARRALEAGPPEPPLPGSVTLSDIRGLDRLQARPNDATVSLRTEPAPERAGKPSRYLVWEIRIPGVDPYRQRHLLQPRRPVGEEPPDPPVGSPQLQ